MKTDLNRVRKVAEVFLKSEINETKNDIIATHPFTNCWIVFSQSGNFINLKNPDELKKWQDIMLNKINNGDLMKIFMMINKPYALMFLKYTEEFIDNDDLADVLSYIWTQIEYISTDDSIDESDLIKLFKRATKKRLMTKEERRKLYSLPSTVHIYRGVTDINKENKNALSWTLNKETAEWFANRYDSKGEVWEREVSKGKILCYFDSRDEDEVIVSFD